jgi:malonate transporter and related proteins
MSLVLNSILPVFAVIALGSFLKRSALIDENFVRVSDRLVYYIFLPLLLFWKIGKPVEAVTVDWRFIAGALLAIFTVFVLSLIIVKLLKMPDRAFGSFSQSCYRFNSYIGIAVIVTALGENGVKEFGVLIGFAVPFINVLAVSSMIRYSGQNDSEGQRWLFLFKSVVANPLIISCLLGILYSNLGIPFPILVERLLDLTSAMSLPLALISVGGSLTFSKFRGHFAYSLIAAFCKLVVLPAIGYLFLKQLHIAETAFTVAMIYFALPTSPQNHILSALLDSDPDLATSAVVLSTMLSIVSLSVILILFVN